MAMRMTGLVSGLDTESIIQQLTAKYSTQKDKVWKQKESLKFKQDAWKDLNKEISSFVNSTLSESRFVSSYTQSNLTLSNSNVASVSGKNFSGQQKLEVKQVATNTYMTGGKVQRSWPIGVDSHITVDFAGTSKEITITSDMSIDQVANKLEDVGLSANFDKKNGRLFLASKATGLHSDFTISGDDETLEILGLGSSTIKQAGQDAIISLNGVDFQSDKNDFEINGLNITAQEEGVTTVSTHENTKIFDMVKDFVDKYNELIKKIDKSYTTSPNGYKPLTDDEKYSLSDRQIEEWEDKLKSSALYKDETLGDVATLLKNDMQQYYNINGTRYSLYKLGISTGNYFTTPEEERNVYNIDETKLKQAIAEDPNGVVSFMSKLSAKMYDDLNSRMKSSNSNSAYSIYPDKQIKKDLADYEKKVSDWEQKITDMEDKYYKQFAKMEAMLSKIQGQGDSLMNLFGIQTN